jgi:elongator complex protein 1
VLLGLVDSHEVWEAALGLYDLEMTANVARLSGRDPREYLPLLEALAAKPDRECCFEIDMMLKRYGKAVVHAIKGGDAMWDKALLVIEKHCLYQVWSRHLHPNPQLPQPRTLNPNPATPNPETPRR